MNEIVRGLRIQIVERIREDIMSGRLVGGARLSELALGRRFGVSRGPVREALVQLAQEGLVDCKPNCGVHVSMPVPNSIRALIVPIRRTIETFALQLIFDELNEDDFRRWEAILNRMARACQEMDTVAAVEQDIAFHRLLLERAGQPDLLAIWSTIVARVRGHFREVHLARREQPIDVHADHQQLVKAFRSGDKEAAVQTLEAHIA
jgi:GntR family transcriptional regulator, rspAB operon transcriptional repressor